MFRVGLVVFRRPRLGTIATVSQLSAWALQCVSCFFLLAALGLLRLVTTAALVGRVIVGRATAAASGRQDECHERHAPTLEP